MKIFLRISALATPLIAVVLACAENPSSSAAKENQISPEQKDYWYTGEAELTSFKLSQARYGELREGTAVLIFVTEDFSTKKFTKSTRPGDETRSVMKLNFTKNFVTGIYPYSVMTSCFVPFNGNEHALKLSASVQEWCGHVYMEMLRKKKYELSVFSYFEDESETNCDIPVTWLEDELWIKMRIDPASLPTGKQSVIPSFAYSRLMHVDIKAYDCDITTTTSGDTTKYQLFYNELDRRLTVSVEKNFPYKILAWEEEYADGFGENKQRLITKGTRITTVKSAYWTKNKILDEPIRKSLGLE